MNQDQERDRVLECYKRERCFIPAKCYVFDYETILDGDGKPKLIVKPSMKIDWSCVETFNREEEKK